MITRLQQAVSGYDNGQRLVASSHHAAAGGSFAFPKARRIWRSGRNGADLALFSILENERVAEPYGRVTIRSGDGIFTNVTAGLAGAGVDVSAVSAAGQLATRPQLAAPLPAGSPTIALPNGA